MPMRFQDARGLIKLDAMENPFSCRGPQQALGRRLGELALNRYPGARIDDLRAALSRRTWTCRRARP